MEHMSHMCVKPNHPAPEQEKDTPCHIDTGLVTGYQSA